MPLARKNTFVEIVNNGLGGNNNHYKAISTAIISAKKKVKK